MNPIESILKRLDLPLNWLICVLQAMHWFNPLLWFAFARMRADREAACDARVLSIDSTDRRAEYGGALLKLQSVTSSRALSLGFVGIFERGSEIKTRISEISTHRPGSSAWRVTGGAIVSLLMVFGITKGQQNPERQDDGNTQTAPPAEISLNNAIRLDNLGNVVPNQEDKPTERRKVMATIVRTNVHFHELEFDEHGNPKTSLHTYDQLVQLESQIKSLLNYDNNQLMVFASGHEIPYKIKTLYSQYCKAKLELEGHRIKGLSERHPMILKASQETNALKSQCDEAIVELRATLQGQLDDVQNRLKMIAPDGPAVGAGIEAILNKLDTIIIPNVSFEDVSIEEAINFLSLRAIELDVDELDPEKKGINFVVRKPLPSTAGAAPEARIHLQLTNVPAGTVLKFICELTRLRYAVDDTAVTLSPKD